MPAWIAEYDPADKDLRKACDNERLIFETLHQNAQDWYDGVIPDVLAKKKNPHTGKEVDNNIKINLFAKRMDRRRDFLFKLFPDLDLDSAATGGVETDEASVDNPGDSDAEDWLEDAWEWNRADTLWGLSVLNGGFTGQVYMQVMEPRPGRDKFPRCLLLSNMITVWQADDVDTPLWYEKYYQAGKWYYRQDIVDESAVGDRQGWTFYQYRTMDKTKGWELTDDPIAWPYELGPIVTWQHWPRSGRYYGAGEFGDIHLNTAVNRILSLGNAVIRNHAFPKTIGTGFSGKALQETSVDGFWTIDEANAKVFNLEMQSDLSVILNYVEKLGNDYNSQGRTTDIEGGPADFTNITNLAIKVSFMPQDDANEILKRGYGYGIVETSKRLQMLAGQHYDVDPIIVWKPALPESKVEVAQVVAAEDKLGLASKETQATQLGLDWLQEQERMQAEQQISKIRRFGPQDVAQAQQNFDALPNLAQLKQGKAGGGKPNGNGNTGATGGGD